MSDPLIDAANLIAQRVIAAEAKEASDVASLASAFTASLASIEARVSALEQPVVVQPPSTFALPKQGISLPLGAIASKSSANQDWMLDQIVALGAGHPMFVRTDWWPPDASGDHGFGAVAGKVAKRTSLVLLPLLNYDVGKRPTAAVFAQQAGQLAGLGYPVIDVLNEPNLGGWTAADAAAYVDVAYGAIAGRALVMGPTVGFNKGSGHPPADVLAWVQAYAGKRPRQDMGACTCYGDAEFVDPAWNGWSVIPQIRQALGQTSPFVVVEGGWKVRPNVNGQPQTLTPLDRGTMSDASYQAICVQTGMQARDAGKVDSFLAYSLLNDASPGGYGLLDDSRAQRAAYGTFEAHAA